jgi:hypothetical protein
VCSRVVRCVGFWLFVNDCACIPAQTQKQRGGQWKKNTTTTTQQGTTTQQQQRNNATPLHAPLFPCDDSGSAVHSTWLFALRSRQVHHTKDSQKGKGERKPEKKTKRYGRNKRRTLIPLFCVLSVQYPFVYEEIDISLPAHAHTWLPLYTNDIPVVHVSGKEIARHGLQERILQQKLEEVGCNKISE